MKKQQVLRIMKWAEELADLYDLGLQNIISRFVDTNTHLKDIEASQKFVELELQTEYTTLMQEVRKYDIKDRYC